jgi:hypothetical protein
MKFSKTFGIFAIFFISIILVSVIYALQIASSGYEISPGQLIEAIKADGTCSQIIYTGTATTVGSYFIPTKTMAEWNAFAASIPSVL